jgi:hypothetical protein
MRDRGAVEGGGSSAQLIQDAQRVLEKKRKKKK